MVTSAFNLNEGTSNAVTNVRESLIALRKRLEIAAFTGRIGGFPPTFFQMRIKFASRLTQHGRVAA